MSVQYLSIQPQQIAASQPVTILTNVVNSGDGASTYEVSLRINNQLEQTKTVNVGPWGTQPVKFTVLKAQPGTYSVDISGQKGAFTVTGSKSAPTSKTNGAIIALLVLGGMVLITLIALLVTRRRPAY